MLPSHSAKRTDSLRLLTEALNAWNGKPANLTAEEWEEAERLVDALDDDIEAMVEREVGRRAA